MRNFYISATADSKEEQKNVFFLIWDKIFTYLHNKLLDSMKSVKKSFIILKKKKKTAYC